MVPARSGRKSGNALVRQTRRSALRRAELAAVAAADGDDVDLALGELAATASIAARSGVTRTTPSLADDLGEARARASAAGDCSPRAG